MADDLEDLKRRPVVGDKSDGRSMNDEAAKSQPVALCLQPGASESRLAREWGVNANQVGRGLREHGHGGRARKAVASVVAAFVAVSVPPASLIAVRSGDDSLRAPDEGQTSSIRSIGEARFIIMHTMTFITRQIGDLFRPSPRKSGQ
uniref:Transposase n=1 Tax=Variovorax paradoxus (strain S110) TaxID=543728 RepID=C5D0Q4_VARPS